MVKIRLDTSYTKNSIKTSLYELRFQYNTNNDYFYFDLYGINGELIRLHNKVVTGYDYGENIKFTSSDSDSYASATTISNFTAVVDG